ncbi:MAG: non-canonical purine NTP pyrophosphatase [Paracoccaceae bacterium]
MLGGAGLFGDRLLVATHNRGKLEDRGTSSTFRHPACVSAAELGLPEPEETETTFVGSMDQGAAVPAAQAASLPALADDSGIEVDGPGRRQASTLRLEAAISDGIRAGDEPNLG